MYAIRSYYGHSRPERLLAHVPIRRRVHRNLYRHHHEGRLRNFGPARVPGFGALERRVSRASMARPRLFGKRELARLEERQANVHDFGIEHTPRPHPQLIQRDIFSPGGSIESESAEGEYATFGVFLPRKAN